MIAVGKGAVAFPILIIIGKVEQKPILGWQSTARPDIDIVKGNGATAPLQSRNSHTETVKEFCIQDILIADLADQGHKAAVRINIRREGDHFVISKLRSPTLLKDLELEIGFALLCNDRFLAKLEPYRNDLCFGGIVIQEACPISTGLDIGIGVVTQTCGDTAIFNGHSRPAGAVPPGSLPCADVIVVILIDLVAVAKLILYGVGEVKIQRILQGRFSARAYIDIIDHRSSLCCRAATQSRKTQTNGRNNVFLPEIPRDIDRDRNIVPCYDPVKGVQLRCNGPDIIYLIIVCIIILPIVISKENPGLRARCGIIG